MTACVVDASVALKWVFPEPGTDAAIGLFKLYTRILVPDLIYPEVANALWKRVVFNEFDEEEARVALNGFLELPLEIFTSFRIARPALEIACRVRRTVYDSLYLALAVQEDCPLVTADLKFYNSIRTGPLARHVRWVERADES